MFNTTLQSMKIDVDAISWKEKHPSLTIKVSKVLIQDFSKKDYFRFDGFQEIILEGVNGEKFKTEIPRDLSGLIVSGKKYCIWYDFYYLLGGLKSGNTEILCINEV